MQLADFHCRDLGYGLAVYLEAVGFFAKARTVADRTDDLIFDVVHDSWPVYHLAQIAFTYAKELVGSINQQGHHLVRQGADRVVYREIVLAGDGTDDLELLVLPHFAQGHYSSFGYAEFRIRHDCIHIYIHYRPKAFAMGAVAFRRVEREGMRGWFLKRKAGFGIHQMFGVVVDVAAFVVEDRQ